MNKISYKELLETNGLKYSSKLFEVIDNRFGISDYISQLIALYKNINNNKNIKNIKDLVSSDFFNKLPYPGLKLMTVNLVFNNMSIINRDDYEKYKIQVINDLLINIDQYNYMALKIIENITEV